MAFAYSDFIAAFPEFSDQTKYPEASFTFWQGIAALRLRADRWDALLDHGSMLFIAHNMAVQRKNAIAAAKGGAVGAIDGPTTAKSIDKLSKSQDVSAVTLEGAGDWNATTYGVQFWQLALMVGSGGRQL
ncbi:MULTISPECIES: DUF4054 domain-containing protein [unclassified Novosphingobium]|uniref:DUF4054 domain-containing protein n=1 Tax=unclassified Novosphingobium TaxID=2644732 RepID=UPI000D2FB519|nr:MULTISPECIES: DUF4054 domain-containing protein [unclassified Novosphingobium]PTR06438.1 uncharacterized protein DUF4054 [Novosphingobium sp. GV055]PUA94857.1 uncharacterized protein DUF4054 [Novosphingobium sp. GV061]PUB13782.1 uncharacterized protein DUF4054 [Novosphingobium sp. GV079]PUB38480.1 uncharacterized protein DUF4054 [Novosphingobium sp. GV027]